MDVSGEIQEAWDLIQEHQFPIDCKDQNYFVSKYWLYGWGSYISVTWRTLEWTTQVNTKNMKILNFSVQ
jgi:hypothetical protein